MSIFQFIKTSLFFITLISGSSVVLAAEQKSLNSPIYILHQANNIPLDAFVHSWPELKNCISSIDKLDSINEACLDELLQQGKQGHVGALNLKSQILRNRGNNELAIDLINKAISIAPEQHLNHFQLAINYYQQLRKATSGREKWMLSMATAKAYKKAFQLDPTQFHYRYYIAYNYLQVPESMGGSKKSALALTDEAIIQGYAAFHPVRADILLAMNKGSEALKAYVSALEAKQYKRSSFKKAVELAKNDMQLSQRFKHFIQQAETLINSKNKGE